MLGTTVTLAAKPEESEQLSLAASLGDLRLLLRTPLDQEKPTYKAVHIADLPNHSKGIDESMTESTDVASTGTTGPALPTLPPLDKSPAETSVVDKTPEPAPVVDKAPEPPPPVTHTLRIESGESVSTTKFVWDEKNNSWAGGLPAKKVDDKKSEEDSSKGDEADKIEESPKPKPKAPAKTKSRPRASAQPVG